MFRQINGGDTGIRTLGRLAPTPVFETGPFDHSGISPQTSGHSGGVRSRGKLAGVQAGFATNMRKG